MVSSKQRFSLRAALVALGLLMIAAFGSGAATGADAHPAQKLVEEKTQLLRDELHADREAFAADPTLLRDLVSREVLPHFDFEIMSKRVLAKHWRKATREQRAGFVREFRALLVRTYSTALLEYSDLPIDYLSTQERDSGRKAAVKAEVKLVDGKVVPMRYEMYQKDGIWKVYDVSINGVSLVINYRASFSAEIRSGGLDGLVARLSERNESSL